jgi:V/A-type H+-transporting ATPase subunit A
LQREERLQQIVRVVGPDVLPESQRFVLFVAEMLKDGFLAQSAFETTDMYCSPERQVALLRAILHYYRLGRDLIQAKVPLERLRQVPCVTSLMRAKFELGNTDLAKYETLEREIREQLDGLNGLSSGGG